MPRRPAQERHRDSAPGPEHTWPLTDQALIDALIALHHPVRRRLYEALYGGGPATVGELAATCGLAVGSVSHHLKPLHRSGFVEPAPELARDTRESWWRAVHRSLSWRVDEMPPGSVARQVGEMAEHANLRYDDERVAAWLVQRDELPAEWQEALITSGLRRATSEQMDDLGERLQETYTAWGREVDASLGTDDERRRLVRVVIRVIPEQS